MLYSQAYTGYTPGVTVLETIQRGTEYLEKKGIEAPRLQSELLLAHVLGMPRLRLYLEFDRVVTEDQTNQARSAILRRSKHEPLQHIVGSVSFCGLELKVTSSVLIPRPETEQLAEMAWNHLQKCGPQLGHPPLILDVGTGSGCLAIAIAHKVEGASVHAVDRSSAALAIARENAMRHHLDGRIHFFEGDVLSPVPPEERYDLIVTNPPYIPHEEIAHLQPEVRDYDPAMALDGGQDGLDFYRLLASVAHPYLGPHGLLMAEHGDGQSKAIGGIFEEAKWHVVAREQDLSHRDRFIVLSPNAI